MREAAPRVVIIGGGFAGLAAALELPRSAHVTLVDRRPSFEFLPNIHELLSGVKTPRSLRLPLRPILQHAGHAFVRDELVSLDCVSRKAVLSSGRTLGYDVLILAIGGENATRGVPGVAQYALAFKSVDDCTKIRKRLAALAGRSRPDSRADVVIVGGGLEGVEALGEVLRCWRAQRCFRLHVVEARERLLPEAPASLGARVRNCAAPWGVEFRTRSPVREVEPDAVRLVSGLRIPSQATIWTGGPAAPRLLGEVGLAPQAGAWCPCRPTLQSTVHPEIFVAGDAAELAHPIPKQAYHALDMGRCAAHNAVRWLSRQPLSPFRPAEKPMLVSFGDLDCFLVAGPLVAASPALGVGKEVVFELVMAQLDRRQRRVALRAARTRIELARRGLVWPILSSIGSLCRHARVAIRVG